ncbi:MAG: hypothetical protein ABMA26_18330 [Limisphaerales bacterium]
MIISQQSGALKKFRRTPWRFQRTFQTPLRSLAPFTGAILSMIGPVNSGTVLIDSVIFQPKNLEALLTQHHLQPSLLHDMTIVAETAAEVQPLLIAALGGWIDFVFIPSPKPFVLYADHDEYTTFFANSKGSLNKVSTAFAAQGFTAVEDYTRVLR